MKVAEIIKVSDKELDQIITDNQRKLSDIAVEHKTKKVSNVKEIASVKKTIARVLTIKRQRQITQQESKNE